ncbi:MAG: endonuclease/exonuclease/phosphatase family protein [Anaerolineae bacterium]|nr:endonuclease/exonuclease/phosphatase family protein [Anaerolineae bacterium]
MKLRILTLNCWGPPFIARDRSARMGAIGSTLAQMDLDVAGLQELYQEQDRQLVLQGAAAGGLVHSRYFQSGIMGSGLLLLSRFPIDDASFLRFRLNGRPQELLRSDYYAGKGIARTRLTTPVGPIDVYNTHLVAGYGEIGPDVFFYHRVAQAYEIARYINDMSQQTPAILTGDLNSTPDKLPYDTCLGLAALEDSYWTTNPGDPGITVTTDIPYVLIHEPERLDYILYRGGSASAFQVLSSEVVLKTAPADLGILAYSDHYGVCTTFELTSDGSELPPPAEKADDVAQLGLALQEGLKHVQGAQKTAWISTGAAGLACALLIGSRGRTRISRRDLLRLLVTAGAASAGLVSGVSLSLGLQFSEEEQAFREILAELEQE